MKKLLHIIATPREEESRTLRVTDAFLEKFTATHPDWVVEDLELAKEQLPSLTIKNVEGKYVLLKGEDLHGSMKDAWREIIARIEHFLSADAYLISTPMWNFSIPYHLKQYIDIIMQPKYLFRYTKAGAEGLVKDRKLAVITSRGGDYASEQMRALDFQEPYLRTIFGLAGITDMTFIVAQPMDMGVEIQEQKIKEAQTAARELAVRF